MQLVFARAARQREGFELLPEVGLRDHDKTPDRGNEYRHLGHVREDLPQSRFRPARNPLLVPARADLFRLDEDGARLLLGRDHAADARDAFTLALHGNGGAGILKRRAEQDRPVTVGR